MSLARLHRQEATDELDCRSDVHHRPRPANAFPSGPITIFVLIFVLSAGVLVGRADTCSYTFRCTQSGCAADMGGWSGTRSSSGVTREQCETARKMAPSTSPCTCTSDNSSGSTSTGGAMISNTGNFKQDMLTNSVNLMIVSNTKNPMVSSFMQGAATSFISSMFANAAEAQRQQQVMNAEILRRKQEQDEQRRIAQQQRMDAMFARLNQALKLEGVPFDLWLKPMNTGADLQLKSMNSSGPGDLKLKMGDSGGYGIKGLPGIYVGGPVGSQTAASSNSTDSEGKGYGIQGLPGTYVGGPATGQAGDAANAGGMPGLPGIYLNGVQPSQAPALAQAAQTLNGPERTLAQDTALQAAQQNPALTAASQDPRVENFQQANQDYQQALQANADAGRDYQTAQGHVEADKSAIDVARAKIDAVTPTSAQQQAFNQMLAAAKTDEDAAMIARQNFDSTEVHLSASRDHAAAALAGTAPVQASNPTQSSSTVDLSHASQPVTAPLLRTSAPAGGLLPVLAAVSHPAAPSVPAVNIDACLANATHSQVPPSARPTVEQLRAQLEVAKGSLTKLLETHLRENEDREEWAKEMKKGGLDMGYQAFDLTAKVVLGHYAAEAGEQADWARNGMERTQEALKRETSLARQSSLEGEIAAYRQEHAEAERAHELLEQTAHGADQGAKVRDFRGYVTDDGEGIKKGSPITKSKDGDILPALEGFKQIVKITLSDEGVQRTIASLVRHAEYVPLIDRTVTIGSALIDTGYDLTVEYLGFQQLQKADQNSELFYRAAAPLQQKIQVTTGQLKCYQ